MFLVLMHVQVAVRVKFVCVCLVSVCIEKDILKVER